MATQLLQNVSRLRLKKDAGMDISQSGAMAKLFAPQTAMDTTTKQAQMEETDYVSEYHVERMMRDAKINMIHEGTSRSKEL
jgi:alkylation response protein AidB-like acyl-CoA dehydrogenase